MSDVLETALNEIIEDIKSHKETATCGTALIIRKSLYDELQNRYSDLAERLAGVNVFVEDVFVRKYAVENWEWTQEIFQP